VRAGACTVGRVGSAGGGSVVGLVEVCARQADELAGQAEAAQRAVTAHLEQVERGRVAQAVGSGCWLGATLRVLAGSLGELHTVLDEAAQLARETQSAPVIPAPRATEPGPAGGAGMPSPGGEVVAAAVEVLHAWRHRLGPEVMRSLAEVWRCASAARYGEPVGEPWADQQVWSGHRVAAGEGRDKRDDEEHGEGGEGR